MGKNLFFIIIFLFGFNCVFSQKTIYTKAHVKSVNIYRNSAELQNTVIFSVPVGTSKVVVGNISEHIDEKSLQIGMNDKNISILSSRFTEDYSHNIEESFINPEMKKINDSIKIVKSLLTTSNIRLETNKKTLELLDKNQTILVGNNSSTVAQLVQLTQFYTQKRTDLSKNKVSIEKEIEKLTKSLSRLKRNLISNQSAEENKFANGVLEIKILSKASINVKLDLKYLTTGASWQPYYEIKGSSISKPLGLNFKALVRQNTGVDWNNVKLNLVNGVSSRDNTAPVVSPWFLSVQDVSQLRLRGQSKAKSNNDKKLSSYSNFYEFEDSEEEVNNSLGFNISSNQLNVSYDIDIPYDILSNDEEHIVNLYHQKLVSEYVYFSAPNYNREAFLIAKIKDFSQYGLVSAPASIIFENMYIGKTHIMPDETDDELDITLGSDSRISIKRENIKDKSGNKFMSSYQERTITYDLIIRNNKKESITIEIKDRIPLSKNENITVELLEDSKAEKDVEKGILTWNMEINPAKTKKLRISYKIRYPKDYIILNL